MRALASFTKKELLEIVRSGKAVLVTILFLLFGIMNPAVAKLTPWLLETMASSMAEQGLAVTGVRVDAMTSWTQFYKNFPMVLIVFLLIFGGILAGEYQKGTMVHMIAKGLARWKILASKAAVLCALWTVGYWLMYLVTYAYTAYFWDNAILSHCAFAALCAYAAGLWMLSLLLLGSVLFRSAGGALGTVVLVTALSYLLHILPRVQSYLPTTLLSATGLLDNSTEPSRFVSALCVGAALTAGNLLAAAMEMKKQAV